ncbi:hypothetical protein AAHC03_025963 [Spirometra sp. Aus1]
MVNCWNKLKIRVGLKRPPLPENRIIPVGPVSQSTFVSEPYSLKKLYGNNEISTSRYTWYGFFFQNLEEQAQRIANFYFLCIAVVQLFTDSPVSPITSILPLVFVILLTMVKQGYEDWLRHRADREVNNAPVQVVNINGELTTLKAYEIKVGDIVLVRANETFPCDLLLISSSEENGECFITTASLDGETNLKRFVAISATKGLDSPELISKNLKGRIICQQPIVDFYKFFGKIEVTINESSNVITQPVSPECLLLRGAQLRNTDFVYGCAVYTGADTKMSLNSKGKQTKYSQIERKLNSFLLVFLGLLLFVSAFYTVLKYFLKPTTAWYVYLPNSTTWQIVQDFLGFLVLFNYIIPISLYVTIELQKFFGSMFFGWDIEMYDAEMDQPAVVVTSDILEEMGQVQYLFSDKTGTLTENTMIFQRFAVASGAFLAKDRYIFPLAPSTGSTAVEDLQSPRISAAGIASSDMPMTAVNLFLHLALCHTVRVERDADKFDTDIKPKKKKKKKLRIHLDMRKKVAPKRAASVFRRASAMQAAAAAFNSIRRGDTINSDEYDYQASSPDEKAFVESCRDFGVVYHGVDKTGFLVVTVQNRTALRYRMLDVLDFDSDRKCMSVVIQPVPNTDDESTDFDPNAPVLVLCKGAETSMIPRMCKLGNLTSYSPMADLLHDGIFGSKLNEVAMDADKIMDKVNDFASCGLRTLVMGARRLTGQEWQLLKTQLDEARGKIEGREAALVAAYKAVEDKLVLIGCTGIEDKLQEGVPETLRALTEAGIQVWILTGDKEETAVNISYSAGHFAAGLPIIRLTKQSNLRGCLQTIEAQYDGAVEARKVDPNYKFGLVVDGASLNYALTTIARKQFLKLCQLSENVLCCRLTPMQKAEVVKLMKGSADPRPVCAAIGDGGNDVSMILEADVGFGLMGKEGRQAARSADYSFTRFRFVKRALLFHGYHYYVRTANLVQYFFYKNLVFVLTQMLFGIFSLFSMQSVYNNIYLLIYNITMTSFPVMFYGLFEQRLPQHLLMSKPEIYKTISGNTLLSWPNFFTWLAFATWHGLAIFFGIYFLADAGASNGGNFGSAVGTLDGFGSYMMNVVFITVTLKLFLASYHWNVFLLASTGGTLVLNYLIFILTNFVVLPVDGGFQLYYLWSVLSSGPSAGVLYLGMLMLISLSLSPDILYRGFTDSGELLKSALSKGKAASVAPASSTSSPRPRTPGSKGGDALPMGNNANYGSINTGFDVGLEAFPPLPGVSSANRRTPLPYNISDYLNGSVPTEASFPQPLVLHGPPPPCLRLFNPDCVINTDFASQPEPYMKASGGPAEAGWSQSGPSLPVPRPLRSYEYRTGSPISFLETVKTN